MHHEDHELIRIAQIMLHHTHSCHQAMHSHTDLLSQDERPQLDGVDTRQPKPVQRHHCWNAAALLVLPVLEEYRKHLQSGSAHHTTPHAAQLACPNISAKAENG
jgi:hypothetical protein